MKRITRKYKAWNKRHARRLHLRELDHKIYLKVKNRSESQPSSQKTVVNKTRYTTIKCPPVMSLAENIEGVTKVLTKIRNHSRQQRNERTYIDFKHIREISPGAALVLAAELDRWNHLLHQRNRKLQAIDVDEWDDNVRNLLKDMGFFELLQVKTKSRVEEEISSIKFVKFRTGTRVDGKATEDLRTLDLEPFIGNSVPNKYRLYAAVAEAMTNVVHHAYTDNLEKNYPNWWLSASHDASKGEVRILLYDQGSGIPATLPNKFKKRLFGIFPKGASDSEMIQLAHDLTQTGTGESHRGHGLQRDVRKYVESVECHSAYRITSLQGEYTWKKEPDGKTTESTRSLNHPLRGTLIEWRLTLE